MAHLRGVCLLALAGVACSPPPATPQADAPRVDVPAASRLLDASCERRTKGPAPAPEGRSGARIALARAASGLVAYVADPDTHTIQIIDVDAARLLGSVGVGGAAEQVLVVEDGRVVVALADAGRIEVLEPAAAPASGLRLLCARRVPAGPFGLAASPAGDRVVVTSSWANAVTIFDAAGFTPIRVLETERAPAGVTIPFDGRAFVSHIVGDQLSTIDLEGGSDEVETIDLRLFSGTPSGSAASLATRRRGAQGYALASVALPPAASGEDRRARIAGDAPHGLPRGQTPLPRRTRIVVPMVSVDPGDEDRPTEGYYGPPPTLGLAKQAPVAVVVDAASERSLTTHALATTPDGRRGECFLPRSIVARPRTERLYVACEGSDQMLELDARAVDPMRAVLSRFELPRGAAGLAIADDEGVIVAVGAFRRAVRIFRLEGGRGDDVDLAWPKGERNPLVERGRELFHQTDDDRISAHGFACASCHPDGRADGLTWFTPVGPRQTLMLAGRLRDTAPYGWDRDERDVAAYVTDTTSRLGSGIHGIEARAIAAYVESLSVPALEGSPERSGVRQGAEVFARSGCAKCHAGAATTDNTSHDLGSGRARGASFDTPSLRYAKLTAPYFHDGRYPTLEALLQDAGHGMGETATLAAEDRHALRLFLESL